MRHRALPFPACVSRPGLGAGRCSGAPLLSRCVPIPRRVLFSQPPFPRESSAHPLDSDHRRAQDPGGPSADAHFIGRQRYARPALPHQASPAHFVVVPFSSFYSRSSRSTTRFIGPRLLNKYSAILSGEGSGRNRTVRLLTPGANRPPKETHSMEVSWASPGYPSPTLALSRRSATQPHHSAYPRSWMMPRCKAA